MNSEPRVLANVPPLLRCCGSSAAFLIPFLFVHGLVPSAGAQQTGVETVQNKTAPYRLQVTTQAVVLDVVVTDRAGHIVTNLTRDDFAVYDDKVPQVIHTFDAPSSTQHEANPPVNSTAELDRLEPEAPVTLIVLDEINTTFQDEAFSRYALEQYLKKQGEVLEHPTLLGAVDMKRFTLLHDYTTSKAELLDALARHKVMYPEQMEGSNWHEQQFFASFEGLLELTQATAGHPGHKSLLWVGRGFPPFDPSTLSDTDMEGIRQILEACTNAMRDARVVLYTLDPAGETTEAATATPDGFLDDPFNGELDFSKIAQATGGHAYFGRNDVDKLIAVSTDEGAGFYTLSYKPSTPMDDTRAFHTIRVVMKNPALTAETRTGYYAHNPAAPPVVNSHAHADRQVFDLGLALQSKVPYDAIHMQVQRLKSDPDKFDVTLRASDVTWVQGQPGKVITKLTVVAEAFDRNNDPVGHTIKLSTLQDGAGTIADTAADAAVSLITSIPANSSATSVRIVIRDEATKKIGAVSYSFHQPPGAALAN
jgi:VWFA-related protein